MQTPLIRNSCRCSAVALSKLAVENRHLHIQEISAALCWRDIKHEVTIAETTKRNKGRACSD